MGDESTTVVYRKLRRIERTNAIQEPYVCAAGVEILNAELTGSFRGARVGNKRLSRGWIFKCAW